MADKSEDVVETKRDVKFKGWGVRHTQCLNILVTLIIAYGLRACMGVALVGMVERNNIDVNISILEEDILNVKGANYEAYGFFNALMLTPPYPIFNWSKQIQDLVMSSFFFGYMLLQIPAGQLAPRFGSRRLIAGAMFINCAASLLFPIVSFYGGWIAAALTCMIQGLAQACMVPSCHTFLGKWTPLKERRRLRGVIYGAKALGPVFSLSLTGFLVASPLGWPGIFRFYGVLAGVSGAVIWLFCADSPAQKKNISSAEKNYIEEALKQEASKCLNVPWRRLLSHRGVYAIIVAHIGKTWGKLTLHSEVPAFMDKVMGVDIESIGLLTALPFTVMYITNFFFSWLFNMLIVREYLSVTWSRKLANSIGIFGSSIGFIMLAIFGTNIFVVEILIVIICGLNSSSRHGFLVNHKDISPNFAHTIKNLSNFCSNCIRVLAPNVVGLILAEDDSNIYQWGNVFFVTSGVLFVSNVVYLLLGTSELAYWNDPKRREDEEESDAMIKKTISNKM